MAGDTDRPTLILCLACGGHYEIFETDTPASKYRMVLCRWCSQGAMDEAQIKAWRAHKP